MSLVSNLISGSTGNFGLIDAKKYGHDTGALRIATESAEALHDIFIEGFYNMEQAELAAVHEGVALESSQYQAVVEASVASVFAKVKEFFKKLWEKVKAFFHSVKRYIDAIFMSGKDFVKKYDADIRKATNLKDFSYKMYVYTNVDDVADVDVESLTDTVLAELSENQFKSIEDAMSIIEKLVAETGKKMTDTDNGLTDDDLKIYNELSNVKVDDDVMAVQFANAHHFKNVSEYSDIPSACFAYFRNWAEDKNDMDDVEISSLSEYASTLKSFNSSKVDKMASNTDKAYKNAIKRIDTLDKLISNNLEKGEVKKAATKLVSIWTSVVSTCQNMNNTYYTAWKTAAKERDSAYKSMIVKAIAYSKKQGKKK